jgi:hypothetical protein
VVPFSLTQFARRRAFSPAAKPRLAVTGQHSFTSSSMKTAIPCTLRALLLSKLTESGLLDQAKQIALTVFKPGTPGPARVGYARRLVEAREVIVLELHAPLPQVAHPRGDVGDDVPSRSRQTLGQLPGCTYTTAELRGIRYSTALRASQAPHPDHRPPATAAITADNAGHLSTALEHRPSTQTAADGPGRCARCYG